MNLSPVFEPKSLAIVGVSLSKNNHPANVIYLKNHLHRPVKVYPVNPAGGKYLDDRVYKSVGDIPDRVDLAVIAVRAEFVADVLRECIESGVGGAVVISGGFAETGRADLQEQLARIAEEASFPFIGPNCLGLLAPNYMDTMFLPPERMIQPKKGNVALVSQSGGIIVDQLIKLDAEGVGVAVAVSIGNKANVKEIDLLRYFEMRQDVDVIVFYIEGFAKGEGRKFVQVAKEINTPVVVIKSGKTIAGSQAVSSHTASLAGDYRVFESVMAQHGVVEAKDERQLIACVKALSYFRPFDINKVGIITGSGGHGAMAVDACIAASLDVPQLYKDTRNQIKAGIGDSIKSIASISNPIDLTGSAIDEDFVRTAQALVADPDIDCILMLLLPYIPGVTSDLGARLSYIARAAEKPMFAYVPLLEKYRMLIEGFELNGVPVSSSIEGAVSMVQSLNRGR